MSDEKRASAILKISLVILCIIAVMSFVLPFTESDISIFDLDENGTVDLVRLDATENVFMNPLTDVLTFDSVKNALHYEIRVGDDLFYTKDTSFDLSKSLKKRGGEVEITLTAIRSDLESEPATFSYSIPGLYENIDSQTISLLWSELVSEGIIDKDGKVTSSGTSKMRGCLILPSNMETIPASAYASCAELESICIPEGVTKIGKSAFANCPNLNNVYFDGTFEQYIGISLASTDSAPSYNGADLYLKGEKLTEATLPDKTAVLASSLYGCTSLKEVTVPQSISNYSATVSSWDNLETLVYSGTFYEYFAVDFTDDTASNAGKYSVKCTNATISGDGAVSLDPDNFYFVGKTAQRTLSGKNLCNIADGSGINAAYIPIGHSLNAGTYTISGVLTSTDTEYELCSIAIYDTYPNGNQLAYFRVNRDTRFSHTFTTEQSATYILIYASHNTAASKGEAFTWSKLQIELGDTATAYEEYCGGMASPSSEYPQDIQCVKAGTEISIYNEYALPAEYQRVEYIAATGTQWIDAGLNLTNHAEIKCDFSTRENVGSGSGYVFGTNGTAGSSYRIALSVNATLTEKTCTFGLGTYGNWTYKTWTRYSVLLNKDVLSVNGDMVEVNNLTSFTTENNLNLFKMNSHYGKFAIYSFSVSQNGVLLRNFVPCYRKCEIEVLSIPFRWFLWHAALWAPRKPH